MLLLLLLPQANKAGVDEALMLDPQGFVATPDAAAAAAAAVLLLFLSWLQCNRGEHTSESSSMSDSQSHFCIKHHTYVTACHTSVWNVTHL